MSCVFYSSSFVVFFGPGFPARVCAWQMIDGHEVLKKSIEDSAWQEFRFDLTKHAGKTIKIELENRASDWSFEAGYWSRIELKSK